MPGGKTHFNKDWLTATDRNGQLLSVWCKANKHSVFTAFCDICNKTIKCDNQGLPQLLQHSETSTHRSLAGNIAEGKQLVLKVAKSGQQDTVSASKICAVSQKDQSTKAELIWAMKVVSSSYSYSSCDGLIEILRAMFPSAIPDTFTMSSSKVSYLISEATGPFFHRLVVDDVKASKVPYSLQYDETTNKQVQKQLDISVRYWSVANNQVNVHHLATVLMGHATGDLLSNELLKSISDNTLPLNLLLVLGSDGPNVNKRVWNNVNDEVLKCSDRGNKGLLDISSCTLHVVHNSFGKGLESYGKNISEFIIEIHQWFKLSAARREDFALLQESKGHKKLCFLKHVECRWLTLEPAIERIIMQYELLQQHFMKDIPKDGNKTVLTNARYLRVKKSLENKETLVQLHFLKSACILFTPFLKLFQKREPLVHILHSECSQLLRSVMGRFMKLELIEGKDGGSLAEVNVELADNHLDNIDIGVNSRKALKQIATEKHKLILLGMKNFLMSSTKYLQAKLPLKNAVIKHCRCLNPQNRQHQWTIQSVKLLAEKLPACVNIDIDVLSDEWRLYQLENISDSLLKDEHDTTRRVDHFWRDIFAIVGNDGITLKYSVLTVFVKSLLVIAHGNSDVERGFSDSGHSVTAERASLNEASINGLRSTRDGLKLFGDKPHLVPMTREFLSLGRQAHSHYVARLEEERANEEKKRKESQEKILQQLEEEKAWAAVTKEKEGIVNKEMQLKMEETKHTEMMDVGSDLFKEGNAKLKEALKSKDMKQIAVAQAILDTAEKQIQEARSKLQETRTEQRVIEKRKQSLMDSFVAKKPKTVT